MAECPLAKENVSGISNDDQQQRLHKERIVWLPSVLNPGTNLSQMTMTLARARAADNELLKAGCIYEYARESRKLRCLLMLMRRRKRAAIQDPYRLKICGKMMCIARLATRYGAIFGFADELADNMSFAELVRTRARRLKQTLHWFNLSAIKGD